MRNAFLAVLLVFLSLPAFGQRRRSPIQASSYPRTAEISVKQAAEELANEKKGLENDIEILRNLKLADGALVDDMQPTNAIQKAWEHVTEAQRLEPREFAVRDGIIRARQKLEDARRSPTSADFGSLRESLRAVAIGPAARTVARNSRQLQEETLAWIKVQELIASQLRTLSEIATESLRVVEE
jgi:hypothetical protein